MNAACTVLYLMCTVLGDTGGGTVLDGCRKVSGWLRNVSLGLARAVPLFLFLPLGGACASDPLYLDPRYERLRIVGPSLSTGSVRQDRPGMSESGWQPGPGIGEGRRHSPRWRPYPGPSWCLRLHEQLRSVGDGGLAVKSCTPVVSLEVVLEPVGETSGAASVASEAK